MYPTEIVIKEMERHRVRMVFHLLLNKAFVSRVVRRVCRKSILARIEARQACSTASDGEVGDLGGSAAVILRVALVDF